MIPRRETSEPFARPARYGRPLLTTAAVAAACAALGVVANLAINHNVRAIQASALIGLLGAAVALRILVNQLRSVHATRDAAIALDQKEVALARDRQGTRTSPARE